MSDSSVVIAEVAVGLAINGVWAVQHDINPFPTFVAGGFLMGTLLFVAEFMDGGIAVAVGGLYLLASFLYHGQAFINVMSNIAQPRKAK